jgi:hypothetical protein
MDEQINRQHVRDPREVSGWGMHAGGRDPQDASDIARGVGINCEFERDRATTTKVGRADGSAAQPAGDGATARQACDPV